MGFYGGLFIILPFYLTGNLDWEEEKRESYHLPGSEGRYTNFKEFRGSFTMGRSAMRWRESLSIKKFPFYSGYKISVPAHRAQTVQDLSPLWENFLQRPPSPSPAPWSSFPCSTYCCLPPPHLVGLQRFSLVLWVMNRKRTSHFSWWSRLNGKCPKTNQIVLWWERQASHWHPPIIILLQV